MYTLEVNNPGGWTCRVYNGIYNQNLLFSKHVQLILMIQAPDRRWSSLWFLH